MSYEGTNHKLCATGHYDNFDAVEELYVDEVTQCECGRPFTHVFRQDQTNGEEPEYPHTMPPDLEKYIVAAERIEYCNLRHPHVIEEARYRVPDDGLWQPIRQREEPTS